MYEQICICMMQLNTNTAEAAHQDVELGLQLTLNIQQQICWKVSEEELKGFVSTAALSVPWCEF